MGSVVGFLKVFKMFVRDVHCPRILCSCYINGLVKLLKGISGVTIGVRELCSLLYADDIVLMADSPEALQKMIDIVETYTSRWRLSLNTNKTKVMIVRPSRNTMVARGEHWSFRNQSLEVVREYKYLGVWFTDNLLWDRHIKHIREKAGKKLVPLRCLFAQRQLPLPIKRQVFTSLVRAVMEYASAVWFCNSKQERKLESLQHTGAVWMLRVNSRSNQTPCGPFSNSRDSKAGEPCFDCFTLLPF